MKLKIIVGQADIEISIQIIVLSREKRNFKILFDLRLVYQSVQYIFIRRMYCILKMS